MNFFQHQDQARKKTTQLVILLIAAVITLIAITILAVAVFIYFFQNHTDSITAANAYSKGFTTHLFQLFNSELILYITAGVIAVVALGSLYKSIQLSAGGKAVAESLGGRLLSSDTRDADERRVLNVIEEMAIASGNPVPQVYILDEPSINAFAAGQNRRNAVIGVTRGCIKLLNRDELQGVMAHEFSHIHNGDMKLNMRLVAILHGILVIGLIGYFILHGSGYRAIGKRDKNTGQQAMLGLALVAIGYSGTFFGNMIKAAVSRQREFLADASAVQFTRNPDGISGALKKIGGFSQGSHISSGAASEFSHMYFGQGIKTAFSGLMATHPPLPIRIHRIQPKWEGDFISNSSPQPTSNQKASGFHPDQVSGFSSTTSSIGSTSRSTPPDNFSDSIINTIGDPQPEHYQQATEFLKNLSQPLNNAAHQAYSARALIYCLLLDESKSIRKQQLISLKDNAHPATFAEMPKLFDELKTLARRERLNLLEICMPALRQMSTPQYQVFRKNLISLIQADKSVSLFEWCLYRMITHTIEEKKIPEDKSLSQVTEDIRVILSLLVQVGENQNPTLAFNAGANTLTTQSSKLHYSIKGLSYPNIDKALNNLSRLKPLDKPQVLKAMIATITADNTITTDEAELFRAIAESLDCPVPPIILN